MKKIITNILIFFASFIFFLLIFFPYTRVVNYFIYKYSKQNNLNIKYSFLTSNFFHTKIKNLEINNFKIDSIIINHNLFKYPFSGIDISGVSNDFSLNIVLLKKKLSLSGFIKLNFLKKFYKKAINGKVNLKGDIDLATIKGLISIFSKKITINDKEFGNIYFKDINGNLIINKNKLVIKKISSKDIPFTISGYININIKNVQNSRINLNGNIKLAGIEKKFKIRGSLKNLRIF